MSLVVTHDLHKTFVHHGRPLHVLRGVSIEIDQGELVAIVGSSGAGKSTLMHCIGTLDLPSKGTIKLGPHQLAGLPGAQLAKIRNETIGFVFQFHHLLPEFDALENVMMPGLIQGRSRKEMVALASKLLHEVGLSKRETHRPSELSGGEQQRVALARALVLNPKLILADEPTGNLDSATSAAIQRLFFEVNERHGTTIVVVTHDPGFAQLMPRVITLKDGEVESDERRAGYRGAAAAGPVVKSVPAKDAPAKDASLVPPAVSAPADAKGDAVSPAGSTNVAPDAAVEVAPERAPESPTAGQVVGRYAVGAVTNAMITVGVIAVAVLVQVLLPESIAYVSPVALGAVIAVVGGVAAERGYSVGFVFSFLPLWLAGAAVAAFGCYRVWGLPGLLGSLVVVVAAVLFGIRRVRSASEGR